MSSVTLSVPPQLSPLSRLPTQMSYAPEAAGAKSIIGLRQFAPSPASSLQYHIPLGALMISVVSALLLFATKKKRRKDEPPV